MSQHFRMDNWLTNPDNATFAKKSVGRGLGTHLTGATLVQKIEAIAGIELICKRGHATTVGAANDDGKCALPSCKQKLMTMAAYEAGAEETEPDADDMPRRRVTGDSKHAQKMEDTIPTGGNLDQENLRTAKSRPRSGLWTGSR